MKATFMFVLYQGTTLPSRLKEVLCFTACGKTPTGFAVLKGHGFSRAVKGAQNDDRL
jgi:hypothetical protein